MDQLTFMTDVAFMQSFLRRKEISKDEENNEQEYFYRWGGLGDYKEKFVQGEMFCTDRFMSSSRGENQKTFLQDEGNENVYFRHGDNFEKGFPQPQVLVENKIISPG